MGSEHMEMAQSMGEEKQWGTQMPSEHKVLAKGADGCRNPRKEPCLKVVTVEAGMRHMLTKMLT